MKTITKQLPYTKAHTNKHTKTRTVIIVGLFRVVMSLPLRAEGASSLFTWQLEEAPVTASAQLPGAWMIGLVMSSSLRGEGWLMAFAPRWNFREEGACVST